MVRWAEGGLKVEGTPSCYDSRPPTHCCHTFNRDLIGGGARGKTALRIFNPALDCTSATEFGISFGVMDSPCPDQAGEPRAWKYATPRG